VLEDLFYDVLILDEGKDAHLALASRAGKGVHLIDLLYKPRPVLAVSYAFSVKWRFISLIILRKNWPTSVMQSLSQLSEQTLFFVIVFYQPSAIWFFNEIHGGCHIVVSNFVAKLDSRLVPFNI